MMRDVHRHSDRDSCNPAEAKHLISFSERIDHTDYIGRIIDNLSNTSLSHVMIFASPEVDFTKLIRTLHAKLECPVVGCTSAGEIAEDGFVEGHIVVLGLPKRWFAARSVLINNLSGTDFSSINDTLIEKRMELTTTNPGKSNGFSFLMIDGLSRCEDRLLSAISPGILGFPLFGGSAGDALRFKKSAVAFDGKIYDDAATLTFVVTNCEISVFSINHMIPGQTRMVVTDAEPEKRIVCSINDEPAAAEYARLIGKDPNQLNEFIFAENPVTVRVADQFYVRAIQRVNEEGNLVFFSAIDQGMVLSVAQAQDMATHLDSELNTLKNGVASVDIIACDCILRRIEAQKSQKTHTVNEVLKKHGIVGFSTYGEQIGPLHVNHTLTGVAIFPPKSDI